MRLLLTKDYKEMSEVAGRMLLAQYYKEGKNNMSITAGSTPELMYEIIKPVLKALPNPNVEFYLFDEIPVKGKAAGVTLGNMNKMLFDGLEVKEIHNLNKDNYLNYDEFIKSKGGIDFIMMGLGMDGHFCGNLSGTLSSFKQGVHAVATDCNEIIEKRLNFLSGGPENREPYYYTYGPETIMNCSKAVFIVSGSKKAEILRKVLEEPINLLVPSSYLRTHKDITFVVDEEAASLLDLSKYNKVNDKEYFKEY